MSSPPFRGSDLGASPSEGVWEYVESVEKQGEIRMLDIYSAI
jgi:hypothetical protein